MTPFYWPTHITLSSSTSIMSHYLGVIVWSAFFVYFVFLLFFVCLLIFVLFILLFVCLINLSVCVHNLVLYFAVCIWAYGPNTITI